MGCPTVTATGTGFDGDIATAINGAVTDARLGAVEVCRASGGDCRGIHSTPESMEILELVFVVSDEGEDYWRAKIKCTFRCRRERGCSPFAGPQEKETAGNMVDEEFKKRHTVPTTEPEAS